MSANTIYKSNFNVDDFITQLLSSQKFDELADKVADKAVEKIRHIDVLHTKQVRAISDNYTDENHPQRKSNENPNSSNHYRHNYKDVKESSKEFDKDLSSVNPDKYKETSSKESEYKASKKSFDEIDTVVDEIINTKAEIKLSDSRLKHKHLTENDRDHNNDQSSERRTDSRQSAVFRSQFVSNEESTAKDDVKGLVIESNLSNDEADSKMLSNKEEELTNSVEENENRSTYNAREVLHEDVNNDSKHDVTFSDMKENSKETPIITQSQEQPVKEDLKLDIESLIDEEKGGLEPTFKARLTHQEKGKDRQISEDLQNEDHSLEKYNKNPGENIEVNDFVNNDVAPTFKTGFTQENDKDGEISEELNPQNEDHSLERHNENPGENIEVNDFVNNDVAPAFKTGFTQENATDGQISEELNPQNEDHSLEKHNENPGENMEVNDFVNNDVAPTFKTGFTQENATDGQISEELNPQNEDHSLEKYNENTGENKEENDFVDNDVAPTYKSLSESQNVENNEVVDPNSGQFEKNSQEVSTTRAPVVRKEGNKLYTYVQAPEYEEYQAELEKEKERNKGKEMDFFPSL